jgi:hypothetical protein
LAFLSGLPGSSLEENLSDGSRRRKSRSYGRSGAKGRRTTRATNGK